MAAETRGNKSAGQTSANKKVNGSPKMSAKKRAQKKRRKIMMRQKSI